MTKLFLAMALLMFQLASLSFSSMAFSQVTTQLCDRQDEFDYMPHVNLHESPIDIIWILDDSASMEPHQRTLTTKVTRILNSLYQVNQNFNQAIVTTSMRVVNNGYQNENRLDSGAYQADPVTYIKNFESQIQVGTEGQSHEKAIDSLFFFLKNHGDKFLRPSAKLVVILLSDLDQGTSNQDESTIAPQYIPGALSLYHDPSHFIFIGFLGKQSAYFEKIIQNVPGELFYFEKNLEQKLTVFGDKYLGTNESEVARFSTSEKLILPHTIKVQAEFSNSTQEAILGFDYSLLKNQVIIPAPKQSAKICISYQFQCATKTTNAPKPTNIAKPNLAKKQPVELDVFGKLGKKFKDAYKLANPKPVGPIFSCPDDMADIVELQQKCLLGYQKGKSQSFSTKNIAVLGAIPFGCGYDGGDHRVWASYYNEFIQNNEVFISSGGVNYGCTKDTKRPGIYYLTSSNVNNESMRSGGTVGDRYYVELTTGVTLACGVAPYNYMMTPPQFVGVIFNPALL